MSTFLKIPLRVRRQRPPIAALERGRGTDVEVLIVGSGFSGLGMAMKLAREGRRSFVILEQAESIGGTWRDNHYPGCACDVPSHLYSYSFEPNPRWTRAFAPQAEIREYLEHCADKYGLMSHLRLRSQVTRAQFDEQGGYWRVHTANGQIWTARHLVLGLGALSRPAYPTIEGIERFAGKAFHSAKWDHEYDLVGKRVAVIGTGASAIQIVPHIAGLAGELHLFQRTPPWVLHKPDRRITRFERWLFSVFPVLQMLARWWIYFTLELRSLGFTVHPKLMTAVKRLGRRQIDRAIVDPELRKRVTPHYMPGCKRILMANDYYPALARPNVKVVTDAISHATERGLVTRDGIEHELDAIIYGTGFRVSEYLTPLEVIGRGGISLNDSWRDGIEAYLGTAVTGFPNLYLLMGPNTGLGHNSVVFMIESQIRLVMSCIRTVERHKSTCAQVRPEAQSAFNARLRPRLARSVWASGCQSWYLDERGKNTSLWPSFTFQFWQQTRSMTLDDFELDPLPSGVEADSKQPTLAHA
jgi:cation diffusion facilitator CzcD-associated flavoprotein CzcO